MNEIHWGPLGTNIWPWKEQSFLIVYGLKNNFIELHTNNILIVNDIWGVDPTPSWTKISEKIEKCYAYDFWRCYYIPSL